MHFQDSCAARECNQTVHQIIHFGLKDVFKSALENKYMLIEIQHNTYTRAFGRSISPTERWQSRRIHLIWINVCSVHGAVFQVGMFHTLNFLSFRLIQVHTMDSALKQLLIRYLQTLQYYV